VLPALQHELPVEVRGRSDLGGSDGAIAALIIFLGTSTLSRAGKSTSSVVTRTHCPERSHSITVCTAHSNGVAPSKGAANASPGPPINVPPTIAAASHRDFPGEVIAHVLPIARCSRER
jgi:hypothetical protein